MDRISKSEFKAHALEVLRNIEKTGHPMIITDRGKPTLEVRKLRQQDVPPLDLLKGSVIRCENANDPVADDDWNSA